MRKLLLIHALWGLLLSVLSVSPAIAAVNGPNQYQGHGSSYNCEAPTHVSWYDPRSGRQTAYNPEKPNGDNVYYVDTDPLAGFSAAGNYPYGGQPDCQGTPVLRQTAYFAVTFHDQNGYIREGWPTCPRSWGDDRNPSCEDEHTGASGAVYVGTGDRSHEVGYSAGATPFWDGP